MFDVLTVAAIADELTTKILNGRIQKLGLVDRLTIAAELYTPGERHWLIISADAQRPRIHLTSSMPSTDPSLITPFGLLIRKYVRGGVLIGIEQPPLDRVVRLSIAKRLPRLNDRRVDSPKGSLIDDMPDGASVELGDADVDVDVDGEDEATYIHLVFELMGRHSNLILVDDEGLIMEAAKHVTPAMSRVRPIWPKLRYTPPPPVDKPDPRRLTGEAAAALISEARPVDDVAKLLVSKLRAVSPQIAREAVYRAVGVTKITAANLTPGQPSEIARALRTVIEPTLTSTWMPAVYRRDSEVIGFSAIPMSHLAASSDEEQVASISAAAELAERAIGSDIPQDHAQRRQRLQDTIRAAVDRVDARLASLEAQEAKAAAADQLRQAGDLIYAYLWQISAGQSELIVDEMTVALDPTLSAKENAAEYFERYRKAQGASAQIPELEEHAQHQLAYLRQLQTLVQNAAGFAELNALSSEWDQLSAELGLVRSQPHSGKQQAKASNSKGKSSQDRRPKPLFSQDGHAIYIGRSGRQNDLVTFDIAGADDTWVHARGVPGSHVIVKWRQPGIDEDQATIESAAALAAHYSSGRESSSVEVDVTRRRHVKKIKGAGPGMVTYRQERTIAVRPMDERALGDSLTLTSPDAHPVATE